MKTWIIVATGAMLLLGANGVQAGADEDAKNAFADGQKQFNDGKYEDAAREFLRAYNLKPAWKLLYNIAQAQAAAKQYGVALQSFEKYIAEGGDEIPVERIDEIRAEIDRLRDKIGNVEIKAPAGSEVFLNDNSAGTTPLPGPLRLTAGITYTLKVVQNKTVYKEACQQERRIR